MFKKPTMSLDERILQYKGLFDFKHDHPDCRGEFGTNHFLNSINTFNHLQQMLRVSEKLKRIEPFKVDMKLIIERMKPKPKTDNGTHNGKADTAPTSGSLNGPSNGSFSLSTNGSATAPTNGHTNGPTNGSASGASRSTARPAEVGNNNGPLNERLVKQPPLVNASPLKVVISNGNDSKQVKEVRKDKISPETKLNGKVDEKTVEKTVEKSVDKPAEKLTFTLNASVLRGKEEKRIEKHDKPNERILEKHPEKNERGFDKMEEKIVVEKDKGLEKIVEKQPERPPSRVDKEKSVSTRNDKPPARVGDRREDRNHKEHDKKEMMEVVEKGDKVDPHKHPEKPDLKRPRSDLGVSISNVEPRTKIPRKDLPKTDTKLPPVPLPKPPIKKLNDKGEKPSGAPLPIHLDAIIETAKQLKRAGDKERSVDFHLCLKNYVNAILHYFLVCIIHEETSNWTGAKALYNQIGKFYGEFITCHHDKNALEVKVLLSLSHLSGVLAFGRAYHINKTSVEEKQNEFSKKPPLDKKKQQTHFKSLVDELKLQAENLEGASSSFSRLDTLPEPLKRFESTNILSVEKKDVEEFLKYLKQFFEKEVK
eukprot:TRINITY_DN3115_c0_g1_i7.p1 TRINITY_DN3115_c0_g1~~TRINITY_DN3115_c0_g1_i7.p1  ORF type:complete len:601 (+),score=134.15 TRINITY_DN3115_c0_g1_i7:27-1805(+)